MAESAKSRQARWPELHALTMLGASLATVAGAPVSSSAWLAALSFAGLTYVFRGRWTPGGGYGPANAVTAFRFLLVCVLLSISARLPFLSFALAFTVLMLDGVDGWLARRFASPSAYGDLLDKEVDAFFTLALCLALYRSERLGLWVLIPGVMRYFYVLFIRYARPPATRETPAPWSRALGAITLGCLMLALLPLPRAGIWLGGAATVLVLASFGRSFRLLYRA